MSEFAPFPRNYLQLQFYFSVISISNTEEIITSFNREQKMSIESSRYLDRGVSSSKSEIHDAIRNLDQGVFPGAFCKILPDHLTGSDDHCVIMHADGAGTKSSLAYLYWKETGDLSVFKDLAMDSLVMNIDDVACVGAIDNFVLSNTIGRNKKLIPGEVIQAIIEGYEEALDMLNQYGVKIQFAGGETADLGDIVRTLVVDSTVVTRVEKSKIIDCSKIKPGDVIIGLASFGGTAPWEKNSNSGIGSNGLTAARHDLLSNEYAEQYPETYSPEIPKDLVYSGRSKVGDILPGTEMTVGKALLSPCRTYTPVLTQILDKFRSRINGIIHCTGGGQTKCIKFAKKVHFVKDNLFSIPPLFEFIREETKSSLQDLFPIFNMGHRLELYVSEDVADDIMGLALEHFIDARLIGRCESNDGEESKLTIKHEGQTFKYQ